MSEPYHVFLSARANICFDKQQPQSCLPCYITYLVNENQISPKVCINIHRKVLTRAHCQLIQTASLVCSFYLPSFLSSHKGYQDRKDPQYHLLDVKGN